MVRRVDTRNLAFPKPSHRKRQKLEPIFYPEGPSGREVINTDSAEGKRILSSRRERAWNIYGRCCWMCGKPLSFEEMELEHILPKGMNGSTHDDRQKNLAAACHDCNSKKGSSRVDTNSLAIVSL
jgi:5-methylcytosine-specific restriction endonuclease McrA